MKEELTIYHRIDETVQIGDVVSTTTSSFDYNGITHEFDNEAAESTIVIAILIESDYSQYEPGKHTDGGAYGFDYYKVVGIQW